MKKPDTVEAMVDASSEYMRARLRGTYEPNKHDVIPTNEFMLDLCCRLLALEEAINERNTPDE